MRLTEEGGVSTVTISNIELSQQPELTLDVQIVGSGDLLIIGDAATVETILSGDFESLASAPNFQEAADYILPNPYSVAYAGGEGWGDLFTLVVLGTATNSTGSMSESETETVVETLNALYTVVSSSSISTTINEDGSQLSRMVLTLAE